MKLKAGFSWEQFATFIAFKLLLLTIERKSKQMIIRICFKNLAQQHCCYSKAGWLKSCNRSADTNRMHVKVVAIKMALWHKSFLADSTRKWPFFLKGKIGLEDREAQGMIRQSVEAGWSAYRMRSLVNLHMVFVTKSLSAVFTPELACILPRETSG